MVLPLTSKPAHAKSSPLARLILIEGSRFSRRGESYELLHLQAK